VPLLPDPPRVVVSHDHALGFLNAVEYGRVADDQPPDHWRRVSDAFGFQLAAPGGRPVGFHITAFRDFDPDDPRVSEIWSGPRFAAPVLGLEDATAGEIALAARRHFGDRSSVDRALVARALSTSGTEALARWTHCLEAGDASAHYALGYTLLDLGRPAEAYAHLRHYAAIAPHGAWNWNYLGRAADAIGETEEARHAFRRAIELAPPDGHAQKVDAQERLARVEERGERPRRRATP
jgi:tetratricopeptide (TPR) repeat protein